MEGPTSKGDQIHGVELDDHSSADSDSDEEREPKSRSDDDSLPSSERLSGQCVSSSASRRGWPLRELVPREVDHEHHHHFYDHSTHGLPEEIPQKAWYEFDFTVVLALISPAGNWLTGGDHIKNLLFVALLVFYLHQVIEVPWKLYQNARRRNRPSNLPPLTSEDKYRDLAISELRKFELICLVLTAISPFMGAYLMRYTTQSVLGPESISWFSTGLFVMATGMRPWSHLIERLSQRTADLQDFIHYLPPSNDKHGPSAQEELESLLDRVDKLERSVSGMKDRLRVSSEDVYDYVDDAIGSMKRSVQKRQKRWDEQEEWFRAMEKSVASLTMSTSGPGKIGGMMTFPPIIREVAQSIFDQILRKWTLSPRRQSERGKARFESRWPSKSSPNGSAVPRRLETILEENQGGDDSALDKSLSFAARLVYSFGYVMLMPFRLAIRVFLG